MTQHQFPLVADAATDFILYPTSDELRQSPDDPLVLAKARRAVTLYSNLLQAILANHGHEIDLDSIEHDRAIGWIIRYRARDPMTITMLHDIAAGDPAPKRSGRTQLSHLPGFRSGNRIACRTRLAYNVRNPLEHSLVRFKNRVIISQ